MALAAPTVMFRPWPPQVPIIPLTGHFSTEWTGHGPRPPKPPLQGGGICLHRGRLSRGPVAAGERERRDREQSEKTFRKLIRRSEKLDAITRGTVPVNVRTAYNHVGLHGVWLSTARCPEHNPRPHCSFLSFAAGRPRPGPGGRREPRGRARCHARPAGGRDRTDHVDHERRRRASLPDAPDREGS